MVGERVAYSMVAILLGYTCDVLQCRRFPQAKSEGDSRAMGKRKPYSYTATLSPLREHELAGLFFVSAPHLANKKHRRYLLELQWHISPPLSCLPSQRRVHHPKMVMATPRRISTPWFFLQCSFLSVCHVAVTRKAKPNTQPGKYMEAYSRGHTGDAINSLARLKPAEALVVGISDEKKLFGVFHSVEGDPEKGGASTETEFQSSEPSSKVQKVVADFLEIGDIVRVPTGSTPPMDGTVASGQSLFDESSVTGESKPIKKNPGDRVFLGTINVGKVIDVRIDVAEGKTMSVFSFFSICAHGLRVTIGQA